MDLLLFQTMMLLLPRRRQLLLLGGRTWQIMQLVSLMQLLRREDRCPSLHHRVPLGEDGMAGRTMISLAVIVGIIIMTIVVVEEIGIGVTKTRNHHAAAVADAGAMIITKTHQHAVVVGEAKTMIITLTEGESSWMNLDELLRGILLGRITTRAAVTSSTRVTKVVSRPQGRMTTNPILKNQRLDERVTFVAVVDVGDLTPRHAPVRDRIPCPHPLAPVQHPLTHDVAVILLAVVDDVLTPLQDRGLDHVQGRCHPRQHARNGIENHIIVPIEGTGGEVPAVVEAVAGVTVETEEKAGGAVRVIERASSTTNSLRKRNVLPTRVVAVEIETGGIQRGVMAAGSAVVALGRMIVGVGGMGTMIRGQRRGTNDMGATV
mmetsp:Transcript_16554/g.30091  ORF Transcript_16554/g.30091 Transcript_16554/m.30091 type:complete len:376 (+) Transcript_16554:594-1721(+)